MPQRRLFVILGVAILESSSGLRLLARLEDVRSDAAVAVDPAMLRREARHRCELFPPLSGVPEGAGMIEDPFGLDEHMRQILIDRSEGRHGIARIGSAAPRHDDRERAKVVRVAEGGLCAVGDSNLRGPVLSESCARYRSLYRRWSDAIRDDPKELAPCSA
jgi:hypothetical protein